jgi:hypothetical protein
MSRQTLAPAADGNVAAFCGAAMAYAWKLAIGNYLLGGGFLNSRPATRIRVSAG